MSQAQGMTLHCWFDFEDGHTCMLIDEHDGPHEPTPDSDILISLAPPDKEVTVSTTFRSTETIEVPADWKWDGSLDALLEFTDLDASTAELVDWDVRE